MNKNTPQKGDFYIKIGYLSEKFEKRDFRLKVSCLLQLCGRHESAKGGRDEGAKGRDEALYNHYDDFSLCSK